MTFFGPSQNNLLQESVEPLAFKMIVKNKYLLLFEAALPVSALSTIWCIADTSKRFFLGPY